MTQPDVGTGSVQLRWARPGDEMAVAAVHVRSWQVAYRGLVPAEYLDGLRPEERAARYSFADRLPGRPATMLAVDGDRILGFAPQELPGIWATPALARSTPSMSIPTVGAVV